MRMENEPPFSISSNLDTDLPVWKIRYAAGDVKGDACNAATCAAGFCRELWSSAAVNPVFPNN